jgi:hypothetical protein
MLIRDRITCNIQDYKLPMFDTSDKELLSAKVQLFHTGICPLCLKSSSRCEETSDIVCVNLSLRCFYNNTVIFHNYIDNSDRNYYVHKSCVRMDILKKCGE